VGVPTGQTIPGVKNLIHWTNNWAPRLGFAWQPRDGGKTVVRGNVGLYIDGPVSSSWYAPPPARGAEEYYILLATGSWYKYSTKMVGATADKMLDPNAKPAKTWQYSLGVDRQLGKDWAIGAMVIYKDTTDQMGWHILDDGIYTPFTFTDPFTGNTFQLRSTIKAPTQLKGNSTGDVLGGDQNYAQQYKGLVLQIRKRYAAKWELSGSYTLSKASGYEVRPTDTGGGGQGLPNYTASAGSDPNQWLNTGGLLTGDRKHMVRLLGTVNVGYGFRLSSTMNVQTGRPYARTAQVTPPVGPANAVPMEQRRDSQRYPSSTVLDLGLDKIVRLGKAATLNVGVQALNVFNEDAVEGFASLNLIAGQSLTAANWVAPRQARVTVRLSF
jgi:hypothetical protein